MKTLLYIYVLILASFPGNLNAIPLLSLNPVQLSVGDILNVLVFLAAAMAIPRIQWKTAAIEEKAYVLFLLWIAVEVIVGYSRYSYRAFGELRNATNFLSFAFPLVIVFGENAAKGSKEIVTIIRNLLLLSAWAAFVMFFLAPLLGLTVEDYRGVRAISSSQTFCLFAAAVFLTVRNSFGGITSAGSSFVAVLFGVVGVLSKNRTSLVAVGVCFVLFLVYARRWKIILSIVGLVILAAIGISLFAPSLARDTEIALQGVLNPEEDPNAQWRFLYQTAALEQVFEAPYLGQGFGSYFEILVPGLNYDQPDQNTPHNQFLVILMKAGLVGLILWLVAAIALIQQLARLRELALREPGLHAVVVTLVLILASQFIYGFAYDFFPFYGIYFALGILLIRSLRALPDGDSQEPVAVPST